MQQHAERLRKRNLSERIEVGFLNYSDPDFLATAERLYNQGVRSALIAPYFLISGYFVKVDLPRKIAEAQAKFPDFNFEIADAIGYDERLGKAIVSSANDAAPPAYWGDMLQDATDYCRPSEQCPLYDTTACRNHPGSKPVAQSQYENSDIITSDNKSTGLLVMVHGTPKPVANEEMYRVVEELKLKPEFKSVQVGFMECNEPDIPTSIAALAAAKVERIVAVPYFLHTGTHVADDLPTLLHQARLAYPNLEFGLGEYIGRSEFLTDALADRIKAALGK